MSEGIRATNNQNPIFTGNNRPLHYGLELNFDTPEWEITLNIFLYTIVRPTQVENIDDWFQWRTHLSLSLKFSLLLFPNEWPSWFIFNETKWNAHSFFLFLCYIWRLERSLHFINSCVLPSIYNLPPHLQL